MAGGSETIFASPTGSGVGTEADPYSWTAAMAVLEAGTTLYLKAGTYSNVDVNIIASGNSTNPIYIKPAPGAHVIIDSLNDFIFSGNNVIIDGKGGILELMTDSWTGDRFLTAENFDMSIFGVGSKILNCWIHDFGNVGNWSTATGDVLQGNLIYNIGRGNGSLGHPHYAQNNVGTKIIRENIFVQTYESAFLNHQYGSGGSTLKGFLYEDNIYINGRWLAGSASSKVEDLILRRCEFIAAPLEIGLLGMVDPVHEDYHLDDNNLFDSPIQLKNGRNYTMKRNNITHTITAFLNLINDAEVGIDVDFNNYIMYGTIPSSKWGWPSGFTNYTSIEALRAGTGAEINGTYAAYSESVPPDSMRVIPHTEDLERASIRIANFSEAATVDIDLSTVTGLVNGNTYRLYNAQNPVEYHEFVHDGTPVTVSMAAIDWTVSRPIATNAGTMPLEASIFPKYGVFYLMKAI